MKFAKLWLLASFSFLGIVLAVTQTQQDRTLLAQTQETPKGDSFVQEIRPILQKYCLDCHSTKAKKGSLDLERFNSIETLRKEHKPWIQTIEMIETAEMPPKDKPQPTAEEKKKLITWIRSFLDAEAKARSGDPGYVPLRRLSHTEYDNTIRDLTGVDLKPARDFPSEGAGGEGFTNAAESLTDISPALLTKYLNAAKELANHAVLTPDGFRFSAGKTRRDWTDETIAQIRAFYAPFTADGTLPLAPYVKATLQYRDDLLSKKVTLAEVATKEKLSPKYLEILWKTYTELNNTEPIKSLQERWKKSNTNDAAELTREIKGIGTQLWKMLPIGSYRHGDSPRQIPNDPTAKDTYTVRIPIKPAPGQNEVVLYLASREVTSTEGGVIWNRPRFEGPGKPPLLLSDYEKYGAAYEIELASLFAKTPKYLEALIESVEKPTSNLDELAKKYVVNPALLRRWHEITALSALKPETDPSPFGRKVSTVPLTMLGEKVTKSGGKDWINGWRVKDQELPILLANSSDTAEAIPGNVAGKAVVVHPLPKEFVAVMWKSPIAGEVKISAKIQHAHPACGNGVAWFLEHRRGEKAGIFGEGSLRVGAEETAPDKTLKLEKDDYILLIVDAKDENHVCDLTRIDLKLTEVEKPQRVWDLAKDLSGDILKGNPQADTHKNADVWSFVKGPSRVTPKNAANAIPPTSVLGRWRTSAVDPKKKEDAQKLAIELEKLLSGPRPTNEPDKILYDYLVSTESVLFRGLELGKIGKAPDKLKYGLPKDRFGKLPNGKEIYEGSLGVEVNSVVEIRLPIGLFNGREFVVEGKFAEENPKRLSQFLVSLIPPPKTGNLPNSQLITQANSDAYKNLLKGYEDFRKVFPTFICYPRVMPDDEVVCLKMYHREDQLLSQLFLNDQQARTLDKLWKDLLFISQQAIAENDYLPQFIQYVTQDQPKELLAYYENQRPVFKKRADASQKELEAAQPKHVETLWDFAEKAYRRPLANAEKKELQALYDNLRKKDLPHEEAVRGVLTRIFVSPAFMFRIEKAPAGKEAAKIDDYELATRLSYFLWSAPPDAELLTLAEQKKLRDPKVLQAQTLRMIKSPKTRSLAIEFGAQMLHVRGFDSHNEKNEKLFPMFDAKLKKDIYEETILFFLDAFQNDRTLLQLLDTDATYLNATLAKHYGIPGINGDEFRRVEGVKKYGRGGILGLASVQTKESGASRTSPILRGNWVVETVLGEKLPRPPADVPRLPEEEKNETGLTVRQLVEKHSKVEACAVCHQRIDPFGFAMEKYDPIGRLREKDLGGQVVETKAKLRDGTEFDGLDGLRNYLVTKKKDVIIRLFCRRLLGYALGRSVDLSDQELIDTMVKEVNNNDGRISAAIAVIVSSKQFTMIRGADYPRED